jgi:hypothetical protein
MPSLLPSVTSGWASFIFVNHDIVIFGGLEAFFQQLATFFGQLGRFFDPLAYVFDGLPFSEMVG